MSGSNFWKTVVGEQAKTRGFEDLDSFLKSLPNIDEQTSDTITENVIKINSNCPDPRLKFVIERLVYHLHTFIKEVKVTTDEWKKGVDFITKCGQMCNDSRQEVILASDIFGVSTLVDAVSNPSTKGCTESTILGPFHTENANEVDSSLCKNEVENNLTITGKIKDIEGNPIPGAKIDIWETDKNGLYDVQNSDSDGPDHRGIIFSDKDGCYKVDGVVPVPYSIPEDGPVGLILRELNRHTFRPAHVHFKIDVEGYKPLVTTLYLSGDPFLKSDAVFAVKNSLIVNLEKKPKNSDQDSEEDMWKLTHDFVLAKTDK